MHLIAYSFMLAPLVRDGQALGIRMREVTKPEN